MLFDQLGKLFERALENVERVFDRIRIGQIDAGDLELLDRIIAAAGRKESEVIGGIARLENPARDRNGGAEARCVLIDVERAVEMRDPCPFDILKRRNLGALVIEQVELAVNRGERLRRKRYAVLGLFVGDALKLREERLAVDGRAESLEEMIENCEYNIVILLN